MDLFLRSRAPHQPNPQPSRSKRRLGKPFRLWGVVGLVLSTPLLWATQAEAASSSFNAEEVEVDAPSVVLTGEVYDVEVTMKNTGTVTWTAADNFKLGTIGNIPPACLGGATRYPVPHSVPPMTTVTFNFQITGPPTVMPCQALPATLSWRMIQPGSGNQGWFGDSTLPGNFEVRDLSNKITVETVTDSGGTVVDARFVDGTDPYVVAGFNYFPYYTFNDVDVPEQDRAWLVYDAQRAEDDFRQMARLGVNTVRMWAPGGIVEPTLNTVDPAICSKVQHALEAARVNGIRMILSLPNPNFYKTRLQADFCPANQDFCDQNSEGLRHNLFYSDALRDFILDRHVNLLTGCNLLGRPEVFSFDLWQEPATAAADERRMAAGLEAWEGYVVAEYGDVATAETQWGFTTETCEVPDPDDPTQVIEWICAPDDNQLCCEPAETQECCSSPGAIPGCCNADQSCSPFNTGTPQDWTAMSHDYRRFIDARYQATYEEAVSRISNAEQIAGASSTLKTSGFSTQFATDPERQIEDCRSSGYRMNPRIASRVFDYVAIHAYPWSRLNTTYAGTGAQSDARERYHRLRFLLDYARRGEDANGNATVLPVLLEESGYDVCREPQETNIPATCSNRQVVQDDVYGRVAIALTEVQAHGGLYWTYRDRDPDWRWGTLAIDDTPNPVVDNLSTNFQLLLGRDPDLVSLGIPVVADPFAEVDLYGSLLQSMGDYKTQGDAGGGLYGPVVVEVTEEPGSP